MPVHLKIGSPEASSVGNNEKNFSIPFDFIPHFRTFAPVFRKLVLLLSLLIPALMLPMRGQDSIRVTVLTCSPGQEVYSLYGHTAIRCQNLSSPAEGITPDVVFNYGVFDDTKPYALTPHPLYDNFGDRVSRDEAIAHLGLDADTRYILFFGLIRDYKGLDLLLRAFADSRLRNKKTKLIVAGEFYSNAELYEQLERDLDIAEHIVWYKEFIPADQVRYFFAAADLVAQPYKTATQSGITQIAYHFERPMLVTDVGGLAEIVPHGKVGYVVKPEADAIADALVDFIDNHHESDYHEGILQEKTKYAWSNMTAALVKVADESATKR